MANRLGVPQMSDAKRPKRDYDDRHSRVMRLASGLIGLGCRPRVIELDGLYVEMDPPEAEVTAAQTVVASESTAMSPLQAPDSDPPSPFESYSQGVRSYRSRAREDLQRRIREVTQ